MNVELTKEEIKEILWCMDAAYTEFGSSGSEDDPLFIRLSQLVYEEKK